jgi:hypothetical protein
MRVMERSRMLGEGETSRLNLRYSKETNSTFLWNVKELTATLKRDGESAEDEDGTEYSDPTAVETDTTVTTPTADPGQGEEAGYRIEPGDGATVTTARLEGRVTAGAPLLGAPGAGTRRAG